MPSRPVSLLLFVALSALLVLSIGCASEPEEVDTETPAAAAPAPESAVIVEEDFEDEVEMVDACAALAVDEVAEVLGVDAATVDASPDHLRLMGEFLGSCGYKVDDALRVSYTVAPDGDEVFARMAAQAAPGGLVLPSDPVAGVDTVQRMDGSLLWADDDALHTIQVMDASGAPASDKTLHRALAERAMGG